MSVGDYVRPGTIIFRLVQDDPLKFRGEVPEREAPAITPGEEVRVSVDAFRGETFTGSISRVGVRLRSRRREPSRSRRWCRIPTTGSGPASSATATS